MSKELTKENVIQNKKDAIKCINKLLEGYNIVYKASKGKRENIVILKKL